MELMKEHSRRVLAHNGVISLRLPPVRNEITAEKRVENTTCSGVFLTNFEMFHLVMKHCVECLILLLKQNDFTKRNLG